MQPHPSPAQAVLLLLTQLSFCLPSHHHLLIPNTLNFDYTNLTWTVINKIRPMLSDIWLLCQRQWCQNLLFTGKSSSAWTLATPVAGNGNGNDKGIGLASVLLIQVLESIWTENREYTGLWSENLDSPLPYHICFIPSPFHNILSHLAS